MTHTRSTHTLSAGSRQSITRGRAKTHSSSAIVLHLRLARPLRTAVKLTSGWWSTNATRRQMRPSGVESRTHARTHACTRARARSLARSLDTLHHTVSLHHHATFPSNQLCHSIILLMLAHTWQWANKQHYTRRTMLDEQVDQLPCALNSWTPSVCARLPALPSHMHPNPPPTAKN